MKTAAHAFLHKYSYKFDVRINSTEIQLGNFDGKSHTFVFVLV